MNNEWPGGENPEQRGPVQEPASDETKVFDSDPAEKELSFAKKAKRTFDDVQYVIRGDEKPGSGKVRQKTRRWGCLGGAMYFLFVVCTAALLAIVLWQAACDVLGLGEEPAEVSVEISKSDDLDGVAEKLKDSGMIKYKWLFRTYGKFTHAMEKIEPGKYTLSTNYDYQALVRNMHTYTVHGDVIDVTIPEGYSVEQTFTLLADKGVCLKEDLDTIAADFDFGFDFLADIEYGEAGRLEGYLFPDTYQFYIGDDPVSVIKKLLTNFDNRFSDDMRAQMAANGQNMRDIVTVASIIEKEASVKLDRPLISSVIYNRLSSSFPYLQIDATVIYALGEHKDALTYEDLEIDHPYNTYKNPGLPPGPISNPGLDSLKAAISPADTDYYYYALKEDGSHQFSRTYEEHQAFLSSQQ